MGEHSGGVKLFPENLVDGEIVGLDLATAVAAFGWIKTGGLWLFPLVSLTLTVPG
jgi:hypothetical protein